MEFVWYILLFIFFVETAFIAGGVFSILKFRLRKEIPLTVGRVLTDIHILLYSGWMLFLFCGTLSIDGSHTLIVYPIGAVLTQLIAAMAIYFRVHEYRSGKTPKI